MQPSNDRQPNGKRSASRINSSLSNFQWKKKKKLYSEAKHAIFKNANMPALKPYA